MLVALFVSVPVVTAAPTVDACQPAFGRCPLNDHRYASCGSSLGQTPPWVRGA